ncbi:hypothetical protein E1286_41055 [Nonomuraea terrae]|uniref:ATP-binding protein n=1 Tax=Nonomuraea terrae TaxID=2530383 RepID=A0A4R4XT20_9ACTN|nr:hypothetical protein [Nonomuraea terrae]TDD34350.1 hypothetical protein E1286_41055 [Nonomuraea terrae]
MHTKQRHPPGLQPKPPWRPPSWNTFLAMSHGLAVRAGWARHGHDVSWVLSARPSAVPTARRMTAARLNSWGLSEHAEAASLLVADLVGQALEHGTATIRLALGLTDGFLRCEVENPGARSTHDHDTRPAPPACCSGVAGEVTWFELPTGTAQAPP